MNMGGMDHSSMGSMTMDDMASGLLGKTGKDLELAFIKGMIPHHEGAVSMAKTLLKDETIKPEFKNYSDHQLNILVVEFIDGVDREFRKNKRPAHARAFN